MGAGNVGDVETFHDARRTTKLKGVCQGSQVFLRVNRRKRLSCKASHRLGRSLEVLQEVAKFGRLLKIELFRGRAHLGFDLLDHLAGGAFEKFASFFHAAEIVSSARSVRCTERSSS